MLWYLLTERECKLKKKKTAACHKNSSWHSHHCFVHRIKLLNCTRCPSWNHEQNTFFFFFHGSIFSIHTLLYWFQFANELKYTGFRSFAEYLRCAAMSTQYFEGLKVRHEHLGEILSASHEHMLNKFTCKCLCSCHRHFLSRKHPP